MAITETQAQRVLWVRSCEQAPSNGEIWSAQDAHEVTRAAKLVTGEKAPFDLFIVRRAELVIEKITKRNPELLIALHTKQSLAIFGWILIVAAFTTGFMTDHLMAERWVNVIEWPIVLLICWNLIFITYLVGNYVAAFFRPSKPDRHTWRTDMLGRWQLEGILSFSRRKKSQTWIKTFETQWQHNCKALNAVRISFVLHAASIAFSIGTLGSLYLRGLFKAYRVGWESTFLSADTMHAIASVVLALGAWIFNMTIPNAAHIAGLQIPNGRGDLAADWIHLYAGSILVCVIIPRLILLVITGYSKSRLKHDFPLSLSSMYYTALRSMQAGHKAAVLAIPFRYELTSEMKSNLTALLERAHGLSSTVTLEQSVIMGHDEKDWKASFQSEDYIAVFVIFSLVATAEKDTHGQVMRRILKVCKGRAPVIPIVDTSRYADRSIDQNIEQSSDRNTLRFDQRCNQWRTLLGEAGCSPLFLDLMTLNHEDMQENLAIKLNAYN